MDVKKIQNAAICGISTELMDLYLNHTNTLLDQIAKNKEVLRVDPHGQTFDLKK